MYPNFYTQREKIFWKISLCLSYPPVFKNENIMHTPLYSCLFAPNKLVDSASTSIMKMVINHHNNRNSLSEHFIYVRYYLKHFKGSMIYNIQNNFETSYQFPV